MERTLLVLSAAIAVALAGVAHAQVYKWVDEKGVVNYSSSPPPKGRVAVKLDEDSRRVSTIPVSEARRDGPAAATDPALRRRVDELEREAAEQRQGAAQQEAAAAEAQRRWVEQCRADRRVDCDDPTRGAYVDPGYNHAYPPANARPRPLPAPSPWAYQPTPHVVQGGGGVVGPYFRPPPSGVVIGPGPYGIGGGYNRASPGGVVLAPGPGGIGAQFVPVPESAAPPRPAPRPRPVPLQQ
jgi:hypothetical protein